MGNHAAIDFLNTRPVLGGEEPTELLPDFPALLRWFRAAGVLGPREVRALQRQWGDSNRARETLDFLCHLREKLRKEILKYEAGGDVPRVTVEEINRLMAEHPMRTRLIATDDGSRPRHIAMRENPKTCSVWLPTASPPYSPNWIEGRSAKCSNCVLHFYETSKKGTRRWCSMQMCGNRAKVATYAARSRR